MIAKDRIAIVRFVPRSTSSVRFAALLPQAEAFDEDNFQTPPGFNLIFLPFADDVRKLAAVKPTQKTPVNRNQVVNAKLLIKSLSTDFDCRNFENPNLQTFYANLQAIALNEDEPEDIEDLLEPDVEGMQAYSNVIDAFKDSVWGGDYRDPGGDSGTTASRAKATKTKIEDGGEGTKKTKKTVERADRTDMDDEDDGGRRKGGRGGARGGARGGRRGKKDSDGDDEGPNEYDTHDGFVVDDDDDGRTKKKKATPKKKNESMDIEEDGEWGDIEKKLKEGEVIYVF